MVRRVIELPLVYKSYIWYSPDQKRISSHYHRQIVNALASGRRRARRADHEGARLRGARPARRAAQADEEPPRAGRGERVTDAVAATGATLRPRPTARARSPASASSSSGCCSPGPFTGRLLGDMGAEIIKVEPPGQPDPLRDWGHARYEGRSLWWPVQSRNKKCVTLNLREERGQELLLELVEQSDVLVENFRPGTLERWNLAPERLWEANPRLVIARVSGLRPDRAVRPARRLRLGRRRRWAASATSTASRTSRRRASTSRSATRSPGCSPSQGILAALYRRDALGGGRGQVVDVSLMEACFALLESMVPEYDRLGIVRGPGGTGLKGVAPSNIFKSSDGKWMVIAANADKVFGRLCEAMGRPELRRRPEVRDPPRPRREPGGARGDRRRVGRAPHRGRDRRACSTRPA